MTIDIRDGIEPSLALKCVTDVVSLGKVSVGEHGKLYYCWFTIFNTEIGRIAVTTRQYRKGDCFTVYKYYDNNSEEEERKG